MFFGKRDKLAIISRATRSIDQPHDRAGRNKKLMSGELLFRLFDYVDRCFRRDKSFAYSAGKSVPKFRAPEEWGDPIGIFRPSLISRSRMRRSHPSITNHVGIDNYHKRPRRFHAVISRGVIGRLKAARDCLASRARVPRSTSAVFPVAARSVAITSLFKLR
jgi:hypothetical protein